MARVLEDDSAGSTSHLLAEREADLHQAVQAIRGPQPVNLSSTTCRGSE
jgi:hypothetical protein